MADIVTQKQIYIKHKRQGWKSEDEWRSCLAWEEKDIDKIAIWVAQSPDARREIHKEKT